VGDALEWFDAQGEFERWEPVLSASRAVLLAMLGRFEEARDTSAAAVARMAELGQYPNALGPGWAIETLAGDHVAAESKARRQFELNKRADVPSGAEFCELAYSLYQQSRYEEAEEALALGRADLASDDLDVMLVHQLEAKLLARRGAHDDAERSAYAAVAIAERTDMLNDHADALSDLAEVLELARFPDQAAQNLAQALDLYERKGNFVMAERTRSRLTAAGLLA
jgi:tetratricopeptide (TPR) repeat protein